LGISSHQINEGERGFSFRFDAPLDMRMHKTGDLSAADIINGYNVEELSRIFRMYGEIRFGWKLAQKIVAVRQSKSINTTGELAEMVDEFVPSHVRNKELAQVFQSIRIEVNDEMASLRSFLEQAIDVLSPGGRLVIMSYHSLEDRLVKSFMSTGNAEGRIESDAYGTIASPLKMLKRKPVTPTSEELESNPRSRSAKLRIAEKI
jgi:16S rRNA (cytosine1402-N4)-methyltransferase